MTKVEFYKEQANHPTPMPLVFNTLIESLKNEMPYRTREGIVQSDDDKRALARKLFYGFYDEDAQIQLWRTATAIVNNYKKENDPDYMEHVIDTMNVEFGVASNVIRGAYEKDDTKIRSYIEYKADYQARRFCYHPLQ